MLQSPPTLKDCSPSCGVRRWHCFEVQVAPAEVYQMHLAKSIVIGFRTWNLDEERQKGNVHCWGSKTGSKSIGLDHCTHQPRFQALTSILPDTGQVATWPEFLRVFFGWWNMVEPQGVGFLVPPLREWQALSWERMKSRRSWLNFVDWDRVLVDTKILEGWRVALLYFPSPRRWVCFFLDRWNIQLAEAFELEAGLWSTSVVHLCQPKEKALAVFVDKKQCEARGWASESHQTRQRDRVLSDKGQWSKWFDLKHAWLKHD